MLEARATAYVVPVDEQPLDSITPVIRIENTGSEAATITGLVRIYRESTGLLVYSSALASSELAAGATADVPALTPWDPAAPADDDYFILFDGQATNPDQGSPHVVDLHLSSYQFDVKPGPMGPAPAAHHVTHEQGGMDEVDVTNLAGVLADPQPPIAHGNADHTSVFEDQANKGVAGGYCGLPNPLNPTMPLRADGTPATPAGVHVYTDFMGATTALASAPWTFAAISGGTAGVITGLPNNPGIARLSSTPAASSGASLLLFTNCLLISGGESLSAIINLSTIIGLTARVGIMDAATAADADDGVYCEITQVGGIDGVIVGKTATASVRSTTASSYTMAISTWYKIIITVNATATLVSFYLYDNAGVLLWSDTLNANIPTPAGQEVGAGILAFRTGGSAQLVAIDFLSLDINRVLLR